MSSASKTKDVTDAIAFSVNGDKEKFKDEFADMDIDEREMTFPIKSEESVQKERKLLVDGTLYHEKRKLLKYATSRTANSLPLVFFGKLAIRCTKHQSSSKMASLLDRNVILPVMRNNNSKMNGKKTGNRWIQI